MLHNMDAYPVSLRSEKSRKPRGESTPQGRAASETAKRAARHMVPTMIRDSFDMMRFFFFKLVQTRRGKLKTRKKNKEML